MPKAMTPATRFTSSALLEDATPKQYLKVAVEGVLMGAAVAMIVFVVFDTMPAKSSVFAGDIAGFEDVVRTTPRTMP